MSGSELKFWGSWLGVKDVGLSGLGLRGLKFRRHFKANSPQTPSKYSILMQMPMQDRALNVDSCT